MYRKALSFVLLGVLVMGVATVTYGTFFDQGFTASAKGLFGGGEHHEGHGREHDDD